MKTEVLPNGGEVVIFGDGIKYYRPSRSVADNEDMISLPHPVGDVPGNDIKVSRQDNADVVKKDSSYFGHSWKIYPIEKIHASFLELLSKGYYHRRLVTDRMTGDKYDKFLEANSLKRVKVISVGKRNGTTEQRKPSAEICFIKTDNKDILPGGLLVHDCKRLINGFETTQINSIELSWGLEMLGFPPTNLEDN